MDQPMAADSAQGRWVLTAAVLGSGMALLDGTVVNIALRNIGEDLDASLTSLQWVVNAYLLSLASLILVGGSLGDRFGRRRIFVAGVGSFAFASALCALAATPAQLVAARLVQGVGAALLTPGSLAIIQSSFRPEDRAAVIGKWAGLGGIAAALGPLVGGWILDTAGWPWIFWINVPVAGLIIAVTLRHVPESYDAEQAGRFDVSGAALTVVALGCSTYAMIGAGVLPNRYVVLTAVLGAVALVAFLAVERRAAVPLVPLTLFGSRVFSAANAMTFLVYGALGAVMFFLILQLQVTAGYSPLRAGLATLPITFALLLLSSYSARLGSRLGPRPQMTLGPIVCGLGAFLLVGVDGSPSYWVEVFPAVTIFALGLAALVAPLTSSVLAAAADRYAGTASGINNAVARTGSLFAVAALPAIVGLTGDDYRYPSPLTDGYVTAMLICGALLVAGGIVSFVGLRDLPAD